MGTLEARSIAVLTLLAVLVFFPSDAGFAQTGSAAVNGTVTDQSGAAISEVRITLTNINTGVRHPARTGSAGVYSLTDIPPGNYTARAQRDGFATKEETGVVLQVNETATLDFTMNIGSVKEMVTVVANLSAVDSTTSELGTVITTKPVTDLPLNGRNFTPLLLLTPGVSPISVAQNSAGGRWLGRSCNRGVQFSFREWAEKPKQHVSAGWQQ